MGSRQRQVAFFRVVLVDLSTLSRRSQGWPRLTFYEPALIVDLWPPLILNDILPLDLHVKFNSTHASGRVVSEMQGVTRRIHVPEKSIEQAC